MKKNVTWQKDSESRWKKQCERDRRDALAVWSKNIAILSQYRDNEIVVLAEEHARDGTIQRHRIKVGPARRFALDTFNRFEADTEFKINYNMALQSAHRWYIHEGVNPLRYPRLNFSVK